MVHKTTRKVVMKICYQNLAINMINSHITHMHTCLMALCPGQPRWAGSRKVKPIWILLKQETVSGRTTPAPHHSVFLQTGYPSCQPTNSIKALKALNSHIKIAKFIEKYDFKYLPVSFQTLNILTTEKLVGTNYIDRSWINGRRQIGQTCYCQFLVGQHWQPTKTTKRLIFHCKPLQLLHTFSTVSQLLYYVQFVWCCRTENHRHCIVEKKMDQWPQLWKKVHTLACNFTKCRLVIKTCFFETKTRFKHSKSQNCNQCLVMKKTRNHLKQDAF